MIINAFLLLFFLIAVFLSIKYQFIQIYFLQVSRASFRKEKTSYYAFLMTLASHIGAGNIVGVTTALILGGPGSILWMIISAFFLSIYALIENTLSVKYSTIINNETRGGACFYIDKGLNKKGLAIIFSFMLLCSSTIFFGPLQVNTLSQSIIIPFKINKAIILVAMFLFAYFVIFKGTKRILYFIDKIVPIMTLVFLLVGLITIIINIKMLPNVVKLIVKDAFSIKSIFGALTGGAVIIGLKRSHFSNEAGLGTTPTLSGMSNIKSSISQGYVQVLSVIIDTAVMCTIMGLMILLYDIETFHFEGVELAIYIYEIILGDFGRYLGSFLLFCFSFATWISSYYSGETNIMYLQSHLKKDKNQIRNLYKILFLLSTIFGIYSSGLAVWDAIDIGMVILGIINIYIMFSLEKDFKNELNIFKNTILITKKYHK